MKDVLVFGTDRQSMYFMSTRFLNKILMDSLFHNFNLLTSATQVILHIKLWITFSWSTLYVVGESKSGTAKVGGLHKVKYIKNNNYYYVSFKQEPTGIQRTWYFVHCLFLWIKCYYHLLSKKMKLYVSNI